MKVYIAGSTAGDEIDRAQRWKRRLELFGIEVISTWIDVVGQHGTNPRDASATTRRTWSLTDLEQVAQADLLWFLVPPVETPTRGAWFEFGVAWEHAGREIQIFTSGDTRQSIFCSLADREFAEDVDAFIAIIKRDA